VTADRAAAVRAARLCADDARSCSVAYTPAGLTRAGICSRQAGAGRKSASEPRALCGSAGRYGGRPLRNAQFGLSRRCEDLLYRFNELVAFRLSLLRCPPKSDEADRIDVRQSARLLHFI
jgi:hypothetical protein